MWLGALGFYRMQRVKMATKNDVKIMSLVTSCHGQMVGDDKIN